MNIQRGRLWYNHDNRKTSLFISKVRRLALSLQGVFDMGCHRNLTHRAFIATLKPGGWTYLMRPLCDGLGRPDCFRSSLALWWEKKQILLTSFFKLCWREISALFCCLYWKTDKVSIFYLLALADCHTSPLMNPLRTHYPYGIICPNASLRILVKVVKSDQIPQKFQHT